MIVQGQTTLFKINLLSAKENFAVGTPYTYKLALYTANTNLNNAITAYTTVGESSGGNYVAGGKDLVITYPPTGDTTNNVAWVSFANLTWTGPITARGALVYNSTTGAACFVLNFGNDVSSTNSFTVAFPTPGSTTAVLTIS